MEYLLPKPDLCSGGSETVSACQIGCHSHIPMADDAIHALFCLIEGQSSVFKIKPTGNMQIYDLRALIKEKKKDSVLSGVDPDDLTLWKVMSL